jgi:hypothetical protein
MAVALYASTSTYPQYQLPNILQTQVTGFASPISQSLGLVPRFLPDMQRMASETSGLYPVMSTQLYQQQLMPALHVMSLPFIPPEFLQTY